MAIEENRMRNEIKYIVLYRTMPRTCMSKRSATHASHHFVPRHATYVLGQFRFVPIHSPHMRLLHYTSTWAQSVTDPACQ